MAPTTLALARIAVFGIVAWKSLSRAWYSIADWPPSFLWRTAAPGLPYVRADVLAALTAATAVCALLGMAGIATRACAAVCFVSLYLFAAVDGGIWDSGWVVVSFLLLLACSRSDDALALRPAVRPLRGASRGEDRLRQPSWEYRWPLRLVQLALVLVYLESGVEKIARSGWGWVSAETLQGWYDFHLWVDTHYFTFGSVFSENPELAHAAAAGALALEVGAIVLPFAERSKWLLVPALAAMHLGIGLTLNIWFTEYFFLLLLFFDWEPARRLFTVSRHLAAAAAAPV
jgi:hypothetical protein